MPASVAILSDLETDALTELVNIGVSRAATSLGDMVGEEVTLSVPNVLLLNREEAIRQLSEREESKLVAVHQVFEGDVTGRALLIFPEPKSLNGCLSTMANMLQRNLKISLPEVLRGGGKDLFNLAPPPVAGDVVLFLYIDFNVRKRDIRGYIAMLMDMPSLTALQVLLQEFIARTVGPSPSNAPA
jgi:chemotaxis protein CheC